MRVVKYPLFRYTLREFVIIKVPQRIINIPPHLYVYQLLPTASVGSKLAILLARVSR